MVVPIARQVVLDTEDVRGLAEFYRALLDLHYRRGDEEPAPGEDWLVLRNPGGIQLAFQRVAHMPPPTWPEGARPQMLHLDLTVGDLDELHRQHDRVIALGAELLLDRSDDEEEPLFVYADPAGHPFCIFVAPRRGLGASRVRGRGG